jgi:hypothetical protein
LRGSKQGWKVNPMNIWSSFGNKSHWCGQVWPRKSHILPCPRFVPHMEVILAWETHYGNEEVNQARSREIWQWITADALLKWLLRLVHSKLWFLSFIRVVDLVVLFPTSLYLPKSEFVWPRYGQNTIDVQGTYFCAARSAARGGRTREMALWIASLCLQGRPHVRPHRGSELQILQCDFNWDFKGSCAAAHSAPETAQ